MAKSKNISTSQLALMTAAAVISLRGLPMMAQEELTMFFYIFFATFLFLIPAALVGAELGSAFAAKGGGVYTWVKEAFNPHLGFTAIFLQWIQNVVWYPTVLGFAAASIAYTIGLPALAQNGPFVGLFSIAMYWFATWVTLRGTSAISGITSRGFLIGTVLPGIVIVLAAAAWLAGGNGVEFEHIPASVSQVVDLDAAHHAHPRLFPHITGMSDIAFLAGILLLCRIKKIKIGALLDMVALGFLIGQSIGRWGNFFNMEAFGTNTTLPWGMTSDTISAYLSRHQAALAAQGIVVDPTLPVHPTFLYESLWNLIGVAILLLWLFPRRSYDGQITLGYTAWYGLGRFFVEGLRTDSLMWGSVRVSQALGGVLFIVAAGLMLFIFLRGRKPMTLEYIEGQKKPRFTLGRYVDTKESRERIAALDAKLAEKKNGKKPTQPEQKEEPHEREDH